MPIPFSRIRTFHTSNLSLQCGKTAVVTGASSGIGEAVSVALLQKGINVVGLARRLENMKKIAERMKDAKGTFHPIRCDLTKEQDILDAFKCVEKLGGADILVNNAGLAFNESNSDSSTDKMKNILDVNLLAVAICIREAIKSMKKRKTTGHIVNINSVLGHNAIMYNIPLSIYQASKYGITGMTEVVRQEMQTLRLPIKVTSVSPGLVKTEMPALKDAGGETLFENIPHVQSKDIADAVMYVLSTSQNSQVYELTIAGLC